MTGARWSIATRRGWRAAGSISGTSAIALAAASFLGLTATLPAQLELIVPFFKAVSYPLGVFGFIVLTYFVINGTSHSVNLTDGLDGLAITCRP